MPNSEPITSAMIHAASDTVTVTQKPEISQPR
jgi:hypothetical protein